MSFPSIAELLKDPCVWIGDTGAAKHITPHTQGMKNMKQDKSGTGITMGNDIVAKGTHTGDLPGIRCDHQGNQLDNVVLTNVSVVPSLAFNLFSITKMQLQGWMLGGDKNNLWITKGRRTIRFDIKIETPEGCVFAMYITRGKESEMGNVAAQGNNNKTTMTFRQAHDRLGHMSDAATRETAKQLGLRIKKTQIFPCAVCAAGKAKQKNIKRTETTKQKIGQRRAYLDIATIKKRQGMPIPSKPNWRIIVVDQRIQIKFSKFFKTKDAMVEPTCEQLHKWQQSNIGITHLRLDNAGENKLLQTQCASKDWKMKCEFEFTARDTPQQNSLAEVGFATLANRGWAMMHRANLPMMDRYRLAHEAFQCATHLDGLTVVEINGVMKTRYAHFVGQNPMFAKHL